MQISVCRLHTKPVPSGPKPSVTVAPATTRQPGRRKTPALVGGALGLGLGLTAALGSGLPAVLSAQLLCAAGGAAFLGNLGSNTQQMFGGKNGKIGALLFGSVGGALGWSVGPALAGRGGFALANGSLTMTTIVVGLGLCAGFIAGHYLGNAAMDQLQVVRANLAERRQRAKDANQVVNSMADNLKGRQRTGIEVENGTVKVGAVRLKRKEQA